MQPKKGAKIATPAAPGDVDTDRPTADIPAARRPPPAARRPPPAARRPPPPRRRPRHPNLPPPRWTRGDRVWGLPDIEAIPRSAQGQSRPAQLPSEAREALTGPSTPRQSPPSGKATYPRRDRTRGEPVILFCVSPSPAAQTRRPVPASAAKRGEVRRRLRRRVGGLRRTRSRSSNPSPPAAS